MGIYEKNKSGYRELIHIDDVADMLGIKPATLRGYISRGTITVRIIKIKKLNFLYSDDVRKLKSSVLKKHLDPLQYKNNFVK